MKSTTFALLAALSSCVAAIDLTQEVRIQGDEELWAKASEEVNDLFKFEDENDDNWISYTAATDYIDKGMQAGLLSKQEAIELWSTIQQADIADGSIEEGVSKDQLIGQLYQNYLSEYIVSETFKEEQKPANHEEGEVDWDDFNNFMQATLDAAEAFYFLDKDRDWVLDYEETEDGIHKLIEVEILDPEEGDELLQDFDFLDEMDGHPDGQVQWGSAQYYATMRDELINKATEITDQLFDAADTDGDYVLTGDEVHFALEKLVNFGEIDPMLAELIYDIFGEAELLDEETDGASWADVSFTIEELITDPEVAHILEEM